MAMSEGRLVTVGEAGRTLGVCADTIRAWCARGILNARRDPRGWRFFTADEIERVKRDREPKPDRSRR